MTTTWESSHIELPLAEQQRGVAEFLEMCVVTSETDRACHRCGSAIGPEEIRLAVVDIVRRSGTNQSSAVVISYLCIPCSAATNYKIEGTLIDQP